MITGDDHVDIATDKLKIWFQIELDHAINELDAGH